MHLRSSGAVRNEIWKAIRPKARLASASFREWIYFIRRPGRLNGIGNGINGNEMFGCSGVGLVFAVSALA